MRRIVVCAVLACVSCVVEEAKPDGGTTGGGSSGSTGGGSAATGGGSTAGGSAATGGGSTAGGSAATGGGSTAGGSAANALTLTPMGSTFAATSLMVSVAATGTPSGPVALFLDSSTTAAHTFTSPPYDTSLNLSAVSEGMHTLVARANFGASEVTSNLLMITVDRTPPTVVSSWPTNAMQPVNGVTPFWHEQWGFTFSEDVTFSSVTASVGAFTATVTPSTTDNRTFRFRVGTTLPATAMGIASLDLSAVRDRAGNTLATPTQSVQFDRVSRLTSSFASPMANETALGGVAVHPTTGEAFIAFHERRSTMTGYDTAFNRVTVRRIAPGVNELLPPLPSATTSSGNIQVKLDNLGRPVVAYDQFATGSTVEVARLEAGAWNRTLSTNPSALDGLSYPKLAFDISDNLIIAGLDRTAGQLRTYKLMGQTWVAQPAIPVTVPPPNQGVVGPALAVNPTTGQIALAWASYDVGNINYRLSVAYQGGMGTFVTVTPFTVNQFYSRPFAPSLGWNSQGLFVAFQDDHDMGSRLGSTVRVAEVDLLMNQLRLVGRALDVDFSANALRPSLTFGPNERPVVAWMEEGAVHLATIDANGDTRLLTGVDLNSPGITGLPVSVEAFARPYPGVVITKNAGFDLVRFNGSDAVHGRSSRGNSQCSFSAGSAPTSISSTNCFVNTMGLPLAAADLIPYDLVTPLWSDGTFKRRWLLLPQGTTVGFNATGAFDYPVGTVMVKEFSIEMTPGTASTRRPIETRFLVKPADGGVWEGYSYQWGTTFTDATLRPDSEARVTWTQSSGSYTHIYPSRTACNRCHNVNAGVVLGPVASQLDRTLDYGGTADNQLRTWNALGLFGSTMGAAPSRVANQYDETESLERRAKGYLQANCSHCHRPGGEQPNRDFRWHTPLANARICATLPDGGTISPAVVPGMPTSSVMFNRINARPGGMPPIATDVADTTGGVRTIRNWISSMTSCP